MTLEILMPIRTISITVRNTRLISQMRVGSVAVIRMFFSSAVPTTPRWLPSRACQGVRSSP